MNGTGKDMAATSGMHSFASRGARRLSRALAAVAATAMAAGAITPLRAESFDLHLDGAASTQPDTRPDGPQMSPGLSLAPYDRNVFAPDPGYADKPYSADDQYAIYGAKHPNPTQRPLLEIGEELYGFGPVNPPNFLLLGTKNPGNQHLWIYGDWRNGVGYNDNGVNHKELGVFASRLNLDIDYQFTSTERIHAFMRPIDKNAQITRYVFAGQNDGFHGELDGNLDALFFEGDLGAIYQGLANRPAHFDLPVSAGRMPLLFQNGIWVLDAIDGFAFTIPARNVPALDISNMDVTFFAGFNHVDTNAVLERSGKKFVNDRDHARVFGMNSFIETMGGYWEAGYGYTQDLTGQGFDYHNATAAFTRRYGNFVSNSVRGIWNFGQNPDHHQRQTADGFLLLVENSFMTGQSQQTVVPYLNGFAGFDRPQPLLRDPAAGGVLVNTGINFETDALTGFPTLDATAANTYGGALGCEFLFGLDRQLVLEASTVQTYCRRSDRNAPGNEYALGLRYQQPLSNAVIFRLNAIYGFIDNARDVAGVSAEIRWKF
jgi:hypothetical protein